MNLKSIKTFCFASLMMVKPTVFAHETIQVMVQTQEKKAIAIGFRVDGQQYGGLGQSFHGSGPKDKEYFFGYREDSVFGHDIHCGSLILSKDSVITLTQKNTQCLAIVTEIYS